MARGGLPSLFGESLDGSDGTLQIPAVDDVEIVQLRVVCGVALVLLAMIPLVLIMKNRGGLPTI